jgi:hypothetical protein
VTDTILFTGPLPEAMGNPPILTIMALAKKMSEIISK